MAYIKIWIHIVWATQNRQKLLFGEVKSKLIEHIRSNAEKKGIHIDSIDGHLDHIHCLISMNSDQNIATIVNLIKGESSFWANRNKLMKVKFGWQDEYFAVSISQSHIQKVRKYIHKQKEYHELKSFNQEVDLFIEKYGFEKVKD